MSKSTKPSAESDLGIPVHNVCITARNPLKLDVVGRNDTVACWHPKKAVLAVAAGNGLFEYDAVSGCRCNCVEVPGTPLKLQYSPDGGSLILLTRERTIYAWSTSTWRRRLLMPPLARYAGKELTAALMAVSGGQQPLVYYTPRGKNTVRTVHTAAPEGAAKGAKLDKEFMPGFKLKTDNKKPIVGLAVHPFDQRLIFVLLSDGTLLLCQAAGGVMIPSYTLVVPLGAGGAESEGTVRALPHPLAFGGALVIVEGASAFYVIDMPPRLEPRVVSTLGFGPGMQLCGTGLVAGPSSLLVGMARHASGNVQVQAWRVMGGPRGLLLLPTQSFPGTVWDAFQGANGSAKPGLAAVSGDRVVVDGSVHTTTGHIALVTWQRLQPGRPLWAWPVVPLLQLVDTSDVAGAPAAVPMHTGLAFWTATDTDNTVSKLRFPRYAHLISDGKLVMYDLTHGLVSDYLLIPPETANGQLRRMRRAVHSTKQAAWLVFAEVVSGPAEGTPTPPLLGQFECTLVLDKEAALPDRWFMPGCSGAFVGRRDELCAVLSNSGHTLAVYETGKLQAGAKALYTADLAEGRAMAVFGGPPSFLPGPPPEPLEQQEGNRPGGEGSEEGEGENSDHEEYWAARRAERAREEAKRLELPRRLLVLGADNRVYLVDVPRTGSGYGGTQAVKPLAARQSLQLRPGEALVQVAWQTLSEPSGGFHTGNAPPPAAACVAALLTTERCLLVDSRLRVVASASLAEDLGLPVSCLWVGPALLVTTASNQVLQVCWDGKAVHLCSLLSGTPQVLLGALADRLLLASRVAGTALAAVAGRGLPVLQPMVLGWATLATRKLLPGGSARVRQELRALVGSYDACQLSVGVLETLANAGFADVAAAVAARSESPDVTPSLKAVLLAAAGDWDPMVALVLGEWERWPHHPRPPPKGSVLYSKLLALARACEAHGRFVLARRLFEAAGAWSELLALCVFQGDFMGLQSYARLAGGDVQKLADQLLAVNEDAFRHAPGGIYGGRPNTEDWRVEKAGPPGAGAAAVGGEGPVGEGQGSAGGGGLDEDIEVAPAGRLPFMEASLQVTNVTSSQPSLPVSAAPTAAAEGDPSSSSAPAVADEGMPIKALDLSTLEAYVGVAGASVVRAAALGAAGAGVAAPATPTGLMGEATLGGVAGGFALGGAAAAAAGAAGGGAAESGLVSRSASGWSEAHEADRAAAAAAAAVGRARDGETAAQAAARADFKRDTADDEDDFFSSDEEEPRHDYDTRSQTSLSTATNSTQQRFKITIRSPEQMGGGDATALRTAALNLRLGSPSQTPTSSARFASPSAGLMRFGSTASEASAAAGASPLRPGRLTSHHLPAPALAPPPGAPLSPGMPQLKSAATALGAGGAPAATGAFADDPFADMLGSRSSGGAAPAPQPDLFDFGLGIGAAAASTTPTPAATPPRPVPKQLSSGSLGTGQPMRPSPPPVAPPSDLLSGWEDFESMFGGGSGSSASLQAAAKASPPVSRPPSFKGQPSLPLSKPSSFKGGEAAVPGLSAFQAGDWDAAASTMARALKAGGDATTVMPYYVTARLLAAGTNASHPAAARLARFAVSLPLDDSYRVALVMAVAERNMAAQNFGFAAEQLTWLILRSTVEGGVALAAEDLQDKLNACDRAGGRDANLPRDEDTEMFRTLVGSCSSQGEADDLVETLIRG